ncbi:MAG: pyruvate/2-oxoglutarate dehydrogenase complex, dihydrolipoamide dehydrogenase component [Nocardioidaceae bacterium]|nr:pyruvate/2-oxoglutarate dehydrogenase complex, dihydrolipoamide dehydrogenase component [Nocardioidaceae bacterium]
MPSTREYDLIVIGAGPVGENVADRAVRGGLTAVIVESELVGGECSYWACMPSKALLRAGAALDAAKHIAGASEAVTGEVDVAAVLRHRDEVTSHWDDAGQVSWLESAGISFVRGHGRITGAKTVSVTATDGTVTHLTARHAVAVSTGTAALLPPIPGLVEAKPWTSREATAASSIPKRLAVLGGGVVAVEMATAYARLGSKVTMLLRDGLLERNEPFAGELVAASLEGMGVDLVTNVELASASRDDAGLALVLSNGSTIVADEILVAIGRSPRTDDLGLASIGLKDGDWMTVDDTMLVEGYDWLYAVGDVNHRALLTHQGKYQARAAGDVIAARAWGKPVDLAPWGTHVATADHEAVPQVVFSDPEVTAVGLTAADAAAAGYETRVVDYDIASVAGAYLDHEGYVGKARMVVDQKRQVVLGVTFVGTNVSELIHSATVAVVGEVPLARLWHAVPSYPTISEVWLRLLEAYGRPA